MKCIACGREMLYRGTHYECSNILCDYDEDMVETKEEWVRPKRYLPRIVVDRPSKRYSVKC